HSASGSLDIPEFFTQVDWGLPPTTTLSTNIPAALERYAAEFYLLVISLFSKPYSPRSPACNCLKTAKKHLFYHHLDDLILGF
ncbi:MAG: hypothetical protein RQ757_09205, partial [Pseudomonadales bacterium]|nr:hypothetical protein [Pseudomonadales bacterium]